MYNNSPVIVNKGLGTKGSDPTLNIRIKKEILQILNQMPSRADFARAAINEKLIRDGYLEESN